MDEELKPGDLLFLTKAFEIYFQKKHPNAKISLVNRLAKLEEIIDWSSEKGQRIKQARLASGKWKDLPIEDNKYIVSVYYHDLVGRKGQKGIAERGVPMFRNHPQTKEPFFEKFPAWVYQDIIKQCESFIVEHQEPEPSLRERVMQIENQTDLQTDSVVIKAQSKKV